MTSPWQLIGNISRRGILTTTDGLKVHVTFSPSYRGPNRIGTITPVHAEIGNATYYGRMGGGDKPTVLTRK